jgi:hypothetical protein
MRRVVVRRIGGAVQLVSITEVGQIPGDRDEVPDLQLADRLPATLVTGALPPRLPSIDQCENGMVVGGMDGTTEAASDGDPVGLADIGLGGTPDSGDLEFTGRIVE